MSNEPEDLQPEEETLLGVVMPPQVEELDLFPEDGGCCNYCTCGGTEEEDDE